MPIPPALIPPEIDWVEAMIWHDYNELSTERPGGMGKTSIPWSSMRAYHAHKPLLEWHEFRHLMRAMDHVFLAHESKPEK